VASGAQEATVHRLDGGDGARREEVRARRPQPDHDDPRHRYGVGTANVVVGCDGPDGGVI
jgi:hypothetical protein